MYSIVIIDDQKYIIEGLKKFIPWEDMDLQLIGTAFDGASGLEVIKEKNPNIIVADIGMPKMTGLEMLKKVREAGLNNKFILLTAHEDFEFAKEAIEYGIVSYILKPAVPNNVINAIKKAITEIEREHGQSEEARLFIEENKQVLLEKFIEELIDFPKLTDKEFNEKASIFNLDIKDKFYRILTVEMDRYNEFSGVTSEYSRQFLKYNIVEHICNALSINGTFINFKKNRATFILCYEPELSKNFKDQNLSESIYKIVEDIQEKYNVNVSIGVGNEAVSFNELSTSYHQSLECLKYFFSQNNGTVIFYDDIIYTQIINPIVEIYNRSELMDALKLRDISLIRGVIDNAVENIKRLDKVNSEYVKMIANEIISAVMSTLYNMGENFLTSESMLIWQRINGSNNITDIEEVFNDILFQIEDNIATKIPQRHKRILEQILEYTDNNYSQEISLKSLSNKMYFTPNYLNIIFSNQMGISYKNYLTKVRMEKAKDLLAGGKHKISMVSEMVGYKNLDYFRKLFKEYTGSNPSDYKT